MRHLGQADIYPDPTIYYDPAAAEAWMSVFVDEPLSDVVSRHPTYGPPPFSVPQPVRADTSAYAMGWGAAPTPVGRPWWARWGLPSERWGYGVLIGGAVVVGMALGGGRRRR